MPPTARSTPEVLVSVDVEASGPSPSTASLIAIGACRVDRPDEGFYRELRPVAGLTWADSAQAVHGLSREHLEAHGVEPRVAMADFAAWLDEVSDGGQPIFVGFNAPFDWMFVADYFHRFLGRNPFGVSALDLKAVYLGRFGVRRWSDTTKRHVLGDVGGSLAHTHHALDDARMQAQLARRLLDRPPTADDGGS
jgi:DNA polymerase III epsilon subunit-like protein